MWPFSRKPRPAGPVLQPLPADGRVPVVGESRYQDTLRALVRGRAIGDGFDEHVPVTAALVPEPANPWDGNAVRVDVVTGRGLATVGYLPRHLAADYQPGLLELAARGRTGTCPARIAGGGAKFYGIYLHLSYPEDMRAGRDPIVAEQDEHRVLLRSDWICTVTGEEHHQDVLRGYAPAAGQEIREIVASLGTCRITRGKYQGQQAIEVRLGDRRVGQLTYAMTQRYGDTVTELLGRGLLVACAAVTRNTAKGVQVELLLPRDPARFGRRSAQETS